MYRQQSAHLHITHREAHQPFASSLSPHHRICTQTKLLVGQKIDRWWRQSVH